MNNHTAASVHKEKQKYEETMNPILPSSHISKRPALRKEMISKPRKQQQGLNGVCNEQDKVYIRMGGGGKERNETETTKKIKERMKSSNNTVA